MNKKVIVIIIAICIIAAFTIPAFISENDSSKTDDTHHQHLSAHPRRSDGCQGAVQDAALRHHSAGADRRLPA